jgi:hypothetical protein
VNDYWEDEEEFEDSVEQTQPRRVARRRRQAGEARGNLYLLTGLILGIGLGLLIAWVISPVEYVETGPRSLGAEYKDEYRRMVALAYAADSNLERARERARLVDGSSAVQQLAAQAQRMLGENRPPQEARAVAVLAAELARPAENALAPSIEAQAASTQAGGAGIESALATETAAVFASTQAAQGGEISQAVQTPTQPAPTRTPTPTRTAIPTFTPRPSATAAGALEAPFVLEDQSEICDGSVPVGLLIIEIADADGEPLPGVRVEVTSQDGVEYLYTGLAPEMGLGYADFQMAAGFQYDVKVGSVSDTVEGLRASGSCGLQLDFTQQAD